MAPAADSEEGEPLLGNGASDGALRHSNESNDCLDFNGVCADPEIGEAHTAPALRFQPWRFLGVGSCMRLATVIRDPTKPEHITSRAGKSMILLATLARRRSWLQVPAYASHLCGLRSSR